MADISALLQLGGMGVMAFAAIAVTRIILPVLSALSDRLLDAVERQTQAIDRLGDVAASMDKRLIVVEQQIDVLQDLIHGVVWPERAGQVRPSQRKRQGTGLIEIPTEEKRPTRAAHGRP